MGFISPNELQAAAVRLMLEGRPPASREDWIKCANFWAANVTQEGSEAMCQIMLVLFPCEVTKQEMSAIVKFQNERRK